MNKLKLDTEQSKKKLLNNETIINNLNKVNDIINNEKNRLNKKILYKDEIIKTLTNEKNNLITFQNNLYEVDKNNKMLDFRKEYEELNKK